MEEITLERDGSKLTVQVEEQLTVDLADTEAVLEAIVGDYRAHKMLSDTIAANDLTTEFGVANVEWAKSKAIESYNEVYEDKAAQEMRIATSLIKKTIKINTDGDTENA